MAVIIGHSEALKKLTTELRINQIEDFKTLEEILEFSDNYKRKKQDILLEEEGVIKKEINTLNSKLTSLQNLFEDNIVIKKNSLKEKLSSYRSKIEYLKSLNAKYWIIKLIIKIRYIYLNIKKEYLENNFADILHNSNKLLQQKIFTLEIRKEYLDKNIALIAEQKSRTRTKRIDHIKNHLDRLKPQIVGAIGEIKVIQELNKLPNEYFVINDYSLKLDSPIFIRQDDTKINSIQIDHLVISRAGIFILETKNWSSESIESRDLFSPVRQIKRTGTALFILLNKAIKSGKIHLEKHHWGERKIQTRNIIVMINNKPEKDFQFVKIKRLDELLGYIKYFKNEFDNEEVLSIKSYLEKL